MKMIFEILSLLVAAVMVTLASPTNKLDNGNENVVVPITINYPTSSYPSRMATVINLNEKISEFKLNIGDRLPWEVDYCYLIYKGQLLDNDRTAEEYGIKSGDLIDRIMWGGSLKGSGGGVDLQSLQTNAFDNVPVETSASVGILKKFIEDKYGVPAANQYLIFNGKLLTDDSAPISKYNVEQNDVVGWVPRAN